MNLLQASKVFLKRNGSTILTCVGGAGVVVTAVLAVKATPKALMLLENAKKEKGAELTKLEVVKVAGASYVPAIITGVSTITCIFGANILNKRQQAAITSAYALLDKTYKEYKAKVNELYGEGADVEVRKELAKDKYDTQKAKLNNETRLFYDEYSERYFESTIEHVLAAEYELNRMMSRDFGLYLNEFYDLLGIDPVPYGDYMGWSCYELVECNWYSWIEFSHTKVVMDDGLECTIIHLDTEPSFDWENY